MMIVILYKIIWKGWIHHQKSTLSSNLIPCCQVLKYGMLWQAQGLVDLWSQKLQILFWRLTSNCAQLQNALANILIWLKWFLVGAAISQDWTSNVFWRLWKRAFQLGDLDFGSALQNYRMSLHLDKMSELEMLKRRILEIALAAALLGDMGQVDSWQYAHHKIVASSGYFFQVISDSIKKCFNFFHFEAKLCEVLNDVR